MPVEEMPGLDALFLHVPRWDGDRREIMVLPLGVPALANMLADDGRATAIVHLGIERDIDPRFSLRRTLATLQPRMVLLSLHWNQQTRSVIDVAHRVRQWAPDAMIVLGGLTASFFAHEIVSSLPFIDAVVRGDGEEPLRALMRVVVDGEGTLADVPNLVWRETDALRENPFSWSLDAEVAERLRHGSLALLRNRDTYLDRALYADFSEGARGSEGYPRATFLNAGRGCTRDCVSCGGAATSQHLTCARDGLVLYPTEKLLRDTRDAVDEGARVLRTCFDPPGSRERVLEWFAGIRAAGWRLRILYDFWYLPARGFLDAMAETFEPGSTAVYSPECGSEAVRFRIRAFPFTNERLVTAIHEAEDRGLDVHCFFTAGLPTETPADVQETARLIERIQIETDAAVSVAPMFLDPASPLFLDPEAWGARIKRRTLRDYYEGRGRTDGPGYETKHFTEDGIVEACSWLLARAGLPPLRLPGAEDEALRRS